MAEASMAEAIGAVADMAETSGTETGTAEAPLLRVRGLVKHFPIMRGVLRPSAGQALVPLEGEIPSPADPPKGCHFHTRCPHAEARCRAEAPLLRSVAAGHQVACHLAPAAA